jgi:hypothetical protein
MPDGVTTAQAVEQGERLLRNLRSLPGDTVTFDYDSDDPDVLILLVNRDHPMRPLHALIAALTEEERDLVGAQHGRWRLTLQAALSNASKSRAYAAQAKFTRSVP